MLVTDHGGHSMSPGTSSSAKQEKPK